MYSFQVYRIVQIMQFVQSVHFGFALAWNALRQRYENRRILINYQLRKIFEIDNVNSEKGKTLRNLQYTVNNCLSILRTYNISVVSWDPILVYWVSSKMPEETLAAWENSLTDHKEMPSWDQLDNFITNRLNMLKSISDMRKTSNHLTTSSKSNSFHTNTDCKVCKQNHPLRLCSKFKSWSLYEKRRFISSNKICENCLSYGHDAQKCRSENVCQKCKSSHHTSLHIILRINMIILRQQSPTLTLQKFNQTSLNPGKGLSCLPLYSTLNIKT